MKQSFLEYLLDKIKLFFLTLFNCILHKFQRHTVQRIEDTEYYEQDGHVKCIQRKFGPTTSNNTTKTAAEERKAKSSYQRKEEKLVQREKKGLIINFTKNEAVAKIKQNIEKCKEKLKNDNLTPKKQRDILKNITKCKPIKIEICHDELKNTREQLKTQAIMRDFPKIAAVRIEKNHEHHKEKKYRECKAQEINVTMSEAERMRAAVKSYSAQQKEKQDQKRRYKDAIDMNKDASLCKARKTETKFEQNKDQNRCDKTREILKDVRKQKVWALEQKCSPRQKKDNFQDVAKEMGTDMPNSEVVKRIEKLKRGFEQSLKEKHVPNKYREIIKAASTNDMVERKRLYKFHERKQFQREEHRLSKNVTTSLGVDMKRKMVKCAELPKQLIGGFKENEIVKRVSKTFGLKEKKDSDKRSLGKIEIQLPREATTIIKDDRKRGINKTNEMEIKDKLKACHKLAKVEKQLNREGTITIKDNKTFNEVQNKTLQREGTIIIKADNIETKIAKTKQTPCIVDESEKAITPPQRKKTQMIVDDEVEFNETMWQQSKLLKELNQLQKNDHEIEKDNVTINDMEFFQKLRIIEELEKVEEQLLENEKILDFLTSDDEDMQEIKEELQIEEVYKTEIEDMSDEIDMQHHSEKLQEKIIKDITAINEQEMEVENLGKHSELLQKRYRMQAEEIIQELSNTEVLELVPIIENYSELQNKQREFLARNIEAHTQNEEMGSDRENYLELQSKQRELLARNIEAHTQNEEEMGIDRENYSELQSKQRELLARNIEAHTQNEEMEIDIENCSELQNKERELLARDTEISMPDIQKEEMGIDILKQEKINKNIISTNAVNVKIKVCLNSELAKKVREQLQEKTNHLIEDAPALTDEMKKKTENAQSGKLQEIMTEGVTAVDELKLKMENKGKLSELKKSLFKQTEEMIHELKNIEVLEIVPIKENYSEIQDIEAGFHAKHKEFTKTYLEKQTTEIMGENIITTDAVKLKVKIGCDSEHEKKVLEPLHEKAYQRIADKTTTEIQNSKCLYPEKKNELEEFLDENNDTIKDVTKEILELIIKCLVSEKVPMDDLRIDTLEEKVKDKLEEKVVEKIMNKNFTITQELRGKQTQLDTKQLIRDFVATQEFKIDQKNTNSREPKQPERVLQLQLRDIINETNEIDEVKIVTAVVVLMTNIIERICQQQQL